MQEVAEFQKVPFEQFYEDVEKCGFELSEDETKDIWDKIKLPERATKGSAGYDFYLPFNFHIKPGMQRTVPTGIRAQINSDWVLILLPRSSLGFKYGFRLVNTAAVIDASYFEADNYGHIMAKISTESNLCLNEGERFIQGIFMPYGIVRNEVPPENRRTGGIGSTGRT